VSWDSDALRIPATAYAQALGTMFMGLLDKLFRTREKSQWEFLKIYSSVSKDRPSSIQREKLVDTLLKIFATCYGEMPKLLDIDGPYGIPKGRPVGVKRFINLLQSKGYDKFYGLTMSDKNHGAWIHFLDTAHELDKKGWDFGYQELIIGHKRPLFSCDLLQVAAEIYKTFEFDYGYIAKLPDNYDLMNESKIKRTFGMISTTNSPTDWTWRNNTNRILDGAIKDVYPTNLLNQAQADSIKLKGFEMTKLNDKISLWSVENDNLETIRNQLQGELIINTVPNKMFP
jgi:hypothetical protein